MPELAPVTSARWPHRSKWLTLTFVMIVLVVLQGEAVATSLRQSSGRYPPPRNLRKKGKWIGQGAVAEAAIQRLGGVEAGLDRASGRDRRAQAEAGGESGKESELGRLEADDFDREAVASHEQQRTAFGEVDCACIFEAGLVDLPDAMNRKI